MGLFKALFGGNNWSKAGTEADIEIWIRNAAPWPKGLVEHPVTQAAIRYAAEEMWAANADLCRSGRKQAPQLYASFIKDAAQRPLKAMHDLVQKADD